MSKTPMTAANAKAVEDQLPGGGNAVAAASGPPVTGQPAARPAVDHPAAIRAAALILSNAIIDGSAAGYVVEWPHRVAGLPTIAVSATAAVAHAPQADAPSAN